MMAIFYELKCPYEYMLCVWDINDTYVIMTLRIHSISLKPEK